MAMAQRGLPVAPTTSKRDDDNASGQSLRESLRWPSWRGSRRRRIFLVLIASCLLYLFFMNMPTDVPPVSQRIDPRYGRLGKERTIPFETMGDPASEPSPELQQPLLFYYNGPIKFRNLAATLSNGEAYGEKRHNVLLVASSLRSAANIIPLACEMARQGRNRVHMALLGRDTTPIAVVKELNSVVDEDCPVQWHDGRPDFATISTDGRMLLSVRAAIDQFQSLHALQVVMFDSADYEDQFLGTGVRSKATETGLAFIPLPNAASNAHRWLSRLNGNALSQWNNYQIDIVVHHPPESSASLIRLLKSLQDADYFGTSLPRLTIELPVDVDLPTMVFLSQFSWPPRATHGDSRLTIRRRTNPRRLTPVQASLQTVESFYPHNDATSHVLVLAANIELSPLYYQYLTFLLLEYKYSSSTFQSRTSLLAISLERPNLTLSGAGPFAEEPIAQDLPFLLSQSPNSNAALYFGDKWSEFHEFLSRRFEAVPNLEAAFVAEKTVSAQYPALLEYLLEYSRAQGLLTVYPAWSDWPERGFAKMHSELRQTPEEFSTLNRAPTFALTEKSREGEYLSADEEDRTGVKDASIVSTADSVVATILGEHKEDAKAIPLLPALTHLPVYSYHGAGITLSEAFAMRETYASEFALSHGGCQDLHDREKADIGRVAYLFCMPDIAATERG